MVNQTFPHTLDLIDIGVISITVIYLACFVQPLIIPLNEKTKDRIINFALAALILLVMFFAQFLDAASASSGSGSSSSKPVFVPEPTCSCVPASLFTPAYLTLDLGVKK